MDAQLLNDITSVFVTAIEAGTATLLAFSLPLLAIFATIAFYMQLGPQLASGGVGVGEAELGPRDGHDVLGREPELGL